MAAGRYEWRHFFLSGKTTQSLANLFCVGDGQPIAH